MTFFLMIKTVYIHCRKFGGHGKTQGRKYNPISQKESLLRFKVKLSVRLNEIEL